MRSSVSSSASQSQAGGRLHLLPLLPVMKPGVTWTEAGAELAVFASRAEAVDVCFFQPEAPGKELARVRLQRGEGGWWRGHLGGLERGWLYGYRVHGPWDPERGLRYNARKLLVDPYALVLEGPLQAKLDMLTLPSPKRPPGSTDNGATALKGVLVRGDYDWGDDRPPLTPWNDTVVYELHVRGFTREHPSLPEELRGTYAGLAHPAVIGYLQRLGVTAVQLLPVHAHLDDGFLVDRGLTNYWGYNTVGFFAPHAAYAACQEPEAVLREFKDMVRALHQAGIEVILDVVYNHTAEGDENGPSLMLRGFDNAAYYRMIEKEEGLFYHNMTGCGNSVDSSQPPALRLILDSLRYWVEEMHVDGFRFDLAVTVARGPQGYDRNSPFLAALAQDPVLSRVKCIAEPWDVGELDSYQLGNFPPPWRELNGRFRDGVRRFWRGDPGSTAGFAKRLCGSEDLFGWDRRPPTSSVNFVTSHDGFTLRDLVSYVQKHNELNGEENRDGDDDNNSWNHGVEGETQDPEVCAKRRTAARSLLATVFCSMGVPFLTAGDERWRTQNGNNNAYCHDNAISWLSWEDGRDAVMMHRFVQELAAFRRQHAVLRRESYLTGQPVGPDGRPDVIWLDETGGCLDHEAWHEPGTACFGMRLTGKDEELLLIFNRGAEAVRFELPHEADWKACFDTTIDDPFDVAAAQKEGMMRESDPDPDADSDPNEPGRHWRVGAHALVCLQALQGRSGTLSA